MADLPPGNRIAETVGLRRPRPKAGPNSASSQRRSSMRLPPLVDRRLAGDAVSTSRKHDQAERTLSLG